jgi:hypothetical protein
MGFAYNGGRGGGVNFFLWFGMTEIERKIISILVFKNTLQNLSRYFCNIYRDKEFLFEFYSRIWLKSHSIQLI